MTDRERAIVMAYTGAVMLVGDKLKIFYDYVDEISNGKYGHDLGMYGHYEEIHRLAENDFLKLCGDEEEWSEEE